MEQIKDVSSETADTNKSLMQSLQDVRQSCTPVAMRIQECARGRLALFSMNSSSDKKKKKKKKKNTLYYQYCIKDFSNGRPLGATHLKYLCKSDSWTTKSSSSLNGAWKEMSALQVTWPIHYYWRR